MSNWFKGIDDRELSQFLNSLYEDAKDKRGHEPDDDEGLSEGYRMLAGNLREGAINGYTYSSKGGTYNNIMLPAWNAFSSTHGGSKQPDPIWRATMPSREPLANSIQALSRYCIGKFDYAELRAFCGMDSFFHIGGVGYARHRWDDGKGIAVTSRFDPNNVYWEAGASSIAKASHVFERHVVPRGEFIKKFGKEKGWKADAHKDSSVSWPKKNPEHDGKTLFDKIEYFLCWSKEGGYKRVYAFTTKVDDEILNEQDGDPGEEWPLELADEDWHLTELKFTPIPGKIEGVSTYWAARDQYIAYQRLNAAAFYSGLKSGKVFLFYPDGIRSEMATIEQAGRTITPVPYNRADVQGRLQDLIEKWEMPEVSKTLLQMRQEAMENWRNTTGVNAAMMLEAQNMETATEAQTIQDSATNMLAKNAAAAESFTTEVFRKEMFVNLSRMPKQSVVCVKRPGAKEEAEGEFEDEHGEEGYEKAEGEEYLRDVPYEDAILLEKGARSQAAVRMIAKSKEVIGGKAAFSASMNGVGGPQLGQAVKQAQEMIPETPEMAIRVQYGVPMDAVCKIVNPGVEQFIGPEAAAGWVEGLSSGEIEAEIGVSVERGSSSATGRMQAVNEVLMLFNALVPIFQQFGLYGPIAELVNAAIKKSEIADLDKARVTLQQIQDAVQKQQEEAQRLAAAEAAAKAGASQQPVEPNPNDMAKADAEKFKSQMGFETQKEKTKQQELKLQGDAVRDRTRSESQLQQGAMMP